MNHICGIEIVRMMYQFCYIDTRTYISFNSSIVYSDIKSANGLSYDIYDINGYLNRLETYEITSIINGINTSKYFTMGCVFNLYNSTIKFCQEDAMFTVFFIAYKFVDVNYYNYINSSYVEQSIFGDYNDFNVNVTFSHCVFIDSPLIEFYKYYIGNISFVDCNSTKLINLESYLLPACRTPDFTSKNFKMIIYYSVSAALFALIVAIVGIAYYWSRKKIQNWRKD